MPFIIAFIFFLIIDQLYKIGWTGVLLVVAIWMAALASGEQTATYIVGGCMFSYLGWRWRHNKKLLIFLAIWITLVVLGSLRELGSSQL